MPDTPVASIGPPTPACPIIKAIIHADGGTQTSIMMAGVTAGTVATRIFIPLSLFIEAHTFMTLNLL